MTLTSDDPPDAGNVPVADDLLRGVNKIGAELGLEAGPTWRLLQKGLIPGARKLGHWWIASRRELRAHFITGTQS